RYVRRKDFMISGSCEFLEQVFGGGGIAKQWPVIENSGDLLVFTGENRFQARYCLERCGAGFAVRQAMDCQRAQDSRAHLLLNDGAQSQEISISRGLLQISSRNSA